MQIQITARHFKLTDEIRNYTEKEIRRLSKYFDSIIEVDVILEWQKIYRTAEVKMTVYGTLLRTQERADELHKAINGAVEKMERQLVKYKDRLRGFEHEKPMPQAAAIEGEQEEEA